jgi:dipeptidyl aminopeptidase/acylaminoacyl peptidase
MLTYTAYKTAGEFDVGYANNIDAAIVAHWEAFFRERSRTLAGQPLKFGPFAGTAFQQQTKFAFRDYQTWNPVDTVRAGMPSALLITGAKESRLLHEMMEGYAALLRGAAVNVETVDMPAEDHFSVLARLGDNTSSTHKRALAWMRRLA